MNSTAIWAIARKDMKSVTANAQVWSPMLILPLLFAVVMPAVLLLLLRTAGDISVSKEWQDLSQMVGAVTGGPLGDRVASFPDMRQQIAFVATNYLLAPFFLMIPLMASTSVSAQSFAGEKERGTLESLLFAPVDLRSLFVGKILGGLLPALGLSYVSFAAYALVVTLLGAPLFDGAFILELHWAPLLLLLIPMISLSAVLFSVYISSRVSTFQAAYQMSGLVVLPVLLLMVGQVSGLLLLDLWLITAVGALFGALNAVLLWLMAKRLHRGKLFESQVR